MDKLPVPPSDKKLWRGFVSGIVTILFCACGQGGFLFLMVTYLEHMQVPVSENGLLKAFLSLVEGATCLLVGFRYRGKNSRLIISASTVLMALSAMVYATQPLGWVVWAATAINAVGIGVLILIPYVATLERRPDSISLGLAVGLYTAAIAGGNSIGAVLAGLITNQYGFGAAFTVSGVTMLLILPAAYFLGTHTNRDTQKSAQITSILEVKNENGWIWKLGVSAGFTLSAVNVVFDTLFPIYGLRSGLSLAVLGSLTGFKMLLAAFIRPFSGAIMNRLNGVRLNNWSLSVLAASTILMPLVGMGFGLVILMGLMGLAFGTARVTTSTLTLHGQNDPQLTSQRSSIYNTLMSLGQTIAPWISGIVAQAFSLTAALIGLPIAFMTFYFVTVISLYRLRSQSQITKLKTV